MMLAQKANACKASHKSASQSTAVLFEQTVMSNRYANATHCMQHG